ncbi:MAG: group II intron reverse transcriptase/maturase [Caldilineaceae bacterium]
MTKRVDGIKMRSVTGRIALLVPPVVVQKYKRKYSRKGKPIHRRWMTVLNDYEIVATYGAQLCGVAHYYLMATDVSQRLDKVYWYGMESLKRTLANKHRRTLGQIHAQYLYRPATPSERTHFRVTITREGKPPLIAKCGEVPLKTRKPSYLNDQQTAYAVRWGQRSEIVARLLQDKCELCGVQGNIEAHHVNKVANIRQKWCGRPNKPAWVEFIIMRNRKTIMVCRHCHQQITHGKYDGERIR